MFCYTTNTYVHSTPYVCSVHICQIAYIEPQTKKKKQKLPEYAAKSQ